MIPLVPLMGHPLVAEPKDADLEEAIAGGRFESYADELIGRLNAKTPGPGGISEATLKKLLDDPEFATALARRQLIAKVKTGDLATMAGRGREQRSFLAWLLRNRDAMENYLIGSTPVGTVHRWEDTWTAPLSSLEIWSQIFHADPDSKEGIYLKLAIATGLNPPGTGNRGAGQAETPEDPVDRYLHYRKAHQDGELFPSFDHLSVWDYRQIVSSNASNADLAWAREAINTWRPDLRVNEQVVNSTSEVWRRNSPIPFGDTFKNVLAGGGKCGPRSSWAVFICQAFGIPTVGVRQPGHACAAYKATYPHVQPQPGHVWKVVYGRAWHVSKSCGLSGPDFMEGMEARSHPAHFSKVERLRWLASTLGSADSRAPVMAIVDKTAKARPPASENAPAAPKASDPANPESEWREVPGVIHIEAETFSKGVGVAVHDCFQGGRQVYSPKYGEGWGTPPRIEYVVDVPETGVYGLTLNAAVANLEQSVLVGVGADPPVALEIPNSHGLWKTTPKVNLRLEKGMRTITLTRPPSQRGLAIRYLKLKAAD